MCLRACAYVHVCLVTVIICQLYGAHTLSDCLVGASICTPELKVRRRSKNIDVAATGHSTVAMTTPLRSNAVDRNSAHRPTWTLTCLLIIQRGAAVPVFSDF